MNIDEMSYLDFINFIEEENRPPGGKSTIFRAALLARIQPHDRVLEIGCTRGFTSLELSRQTGCVCTGVDLHEPSVTAANKRAFADPDTAGAVRFLVADAEKLPFADGSFDAVITGNAPSFMEDEKKAIGEAWRVLRPLGRLITTPMYYHQQPPESVLRDLKSELGFLPPTHSEIDWQQRFLAEGFELLHIEKHQFKHLTTEEIDTYVRSTAPDNVSGAQKRWKRMISVFNENLRYVSFSIFILRKPRFPEAPEAFVLSR